ncbi:MAG: hypothetical protein EPN74_12660 [Rhodanobacter sp.]|nr:MAG: hypothetical protein EPN74_12660 [Rhodanobacter sp.]
MQTLKVSVSFPDATYPEMELRLSANNADGDVVSALPMQTARAPQIVPLPRTAVDAADGCDDEYTLGGYTGI